MRIINAGGFGRTERKTWRATIFNNLVSAFQTIYAAMQDDDTDFEDEDNIVCHSILHPMIIIVVIFERDCVLLTPHSAILR